MFCTIGDKGNVLEKSTSALMAVKSRAFENPARQPKQDTTIIARISLIV